MSDKWLLFFATLTCEWTWLCCEVLHIQTLVNNLLILIAHVVNCHWVKSDWYTSMKKSELIEYGSWSLITSSHAPLYEHCAKSMVSQRSILSCISCLRQPHVTRVEVISVVLDPGGARLPHEGGSSPHLWSGSESIQFTSASPSIWATRVIWYGWTLSKQYTRLSTYHRLIDWLSKA